jgi:hypothetical protein
VQAREVHTHEVQAREMHAHEVHAYEVHAHEGFYEDLARQITVARLFQRQLGLGVVVYGFQ